jgi:hypothetical protein
LLQEAGIRKPATRESPTRTIPLLERKALCLRSLRRWCINWHCWFTPSPLLLKRSGQIRPDGKVQQPRRECGRAVVYLRLARFRYWADALEPSSLGTLPCALPSASGPAAACSAGSHRLVCRPVPRKSVFPEGGMGCRSRLILIESSLRETPFTTVIRQEATQPLRLPQIPLHRRVKQRLHPMLGLKSFRTAAGVISSIELAEEIKKKQFHMSKLGGSTATMPKIWRAALAA